MRGWVVVLLTSVLATVAGAVALIVIATTSSRTAIVDLEIGECFVLPEAGSELVTVDAVDCAAPHDAEVVSLGELNPDGGAAYPTDDLLFADVEQRCRDAGATVSDDFGLLPVAPTPELWERFGGRYLCVAIPFGGDLVTGSIVAG